MRLTFTKEGLDKKCSKRPVGFRDEILQKSIIEDDKYVINLSDFEEIEARYKLPGLKEQIRNFCKSILLKDDSGFRMRSFENITKNAEICFSCPMFIEKGWVCGSCGCRLKIKLTLKRWKCPLNKWID